MNISKLPILTMLLVFIVLISCSLKKKDPYPEFTIPIYKNAYDISTGFDPSMYGKSVQFFVHETFPASHVKQFYEDFLSKKDFSELKNYPHADKAWVQFNSESMKWDIVADSPPARYCRAWVDSRENLMFKFKLNYDVEDKLSVTCFLHPYTRDNQFDKFEKWIAKMGKEKEFGEFLTKYTTTDKKVDTQRALKENPDSQLIMKFAEAVEQDKQNIEAAYKAYKETVNNK
ncbi:MAG: hypothetical protein PVG41_14995 [Desulfobacteraceae bacterium]|jgi:hypothetical protein